MRERLSVADLRGSPELFEILLEHAYRGVRVQFLLRGVLLIFMISAIAAVPPAHDEPACWLIVASYALWSVGVAVWTRRGGVGPVRWMWVALLVDVLALTALTLVAGASAEQSWTADLLVNGFFLLPMLAATQLRPIVVLAVVLPATAAYFASSVATKTANTEPWGSILVRTLVLVGLSAGSVALSWVQLARVRTIAGLAAERSNLLDELLTLEARERSTLAEQLHDGALQYVLAARQDLQEARGGDARSFERVEEALTQSSLLLRSAVSELSPAVLEQAGLTRAVRDLANAAAERADLLVEVDASGWPDGRLPLDGLLYSCARELLTNVVKHAAASSVQLQLAQVDGQARLTVTDDGAGFDPELLAVRLGEGHIGLASLRTRVAAAGGTLDLAPATGGGTTALVTLPTEGRS